MCCKKRKIQIKERYYRFQGNPLSVGDSSLFHLLVLEVACKWPLTGNIYTHSLSLIKNCHTIPSLLSDSIRVWCQGVMGWRMSQVWCCVSLLASLDVSSPQRAAVQCLSPTFTLHFSCFGSPISSPGVARRWIGFRHILFSEARQICMEEHAA